MIGCRSSSCFIKKHKGQIVNGPCHCLRSLGQANELALKRKIKMKDKALREARRRFKEYEMDVEDTAPGDHRDFMKLIDKAIEI